MPAFVPQSIDPQALPSIPFEWHNALPKCPAIYFVLQNEEILYIGRAADLMKRWRNHPITHQFQDKALSIRIAWLECSDPKLLPTIELAVIQFFQPVFNQWLPGSSKKIAQLRTRLNLTQRQVAKAIGVTVQSISNWEQGLFTPTLHPRQFVAWCRILQCSLDDLVEAIDADNETEE